MGNKIGVPYEGFAEFARKVAAEGAVLVKNEDKVLPFLENERITVFGRCQINYYKSGTGSGGAVVVPYSVNLIEGLKNSGRVSLNEEMLATYQSWIAEHPFDNGGGGWAAEPWNQEEMPLSDEMCQRARNFSEKALIVIGRTAGEDKDNTDTAGSYRLTDKELDMIQKVTNVFEKVVLLLNVPDIIDLSWLQGNYKYPIKTVLFGWHGGMEGGNAIADVLTGKVNPSGKLTDTAAPSIADYPSTANYGSERKNIYQEDIYVGYRYFETFAPEKVIYEFGYGLSYTDFSILVGTAHRTDLQLEIPVTVTNTGAYAGKEVVQIYVSAPQGRLGKPVKVLAAFAKTRELQPGESQELLITADLKTNASYDDSGITGHKSCYVLEEGLYTVYAGSSIRTAQLVQIESTHDAAKIENGYEKGIFLQELLVVEQLSEALAPSESFRVMKPGAQKEDGTFTAINVPVATRTVPIKDKILGKLPKAMAMKKDAIITLDEVADKKHTLEEFVAQFDEEELATLVRGEGMSSPLVTPGTASSFGGVTKELFAHGIPLACCADGPSGIRMESGLHATQVPIGTAIASTWNVDLIEELYVFEGKELLRNEIDALLGPGMNLRRNPLNGRNFEYFSEDPLLTGKIAAAIVRGIKAGGSNATLKHFACNSQEKARTLVESVISERAARELYLKGFEIAVKEGDAKAIMTSYNPVNDYWTASNYDLNTTILRNEWGFDGVVMTDWWAMMNDVMEGGRDASLNQTASMVRAQNDLYMVVNNSGAGVNIMNDDTLEALKEGRLTIGELQRCVMNICRFIMQTPVFDRKPEYGGNIVEFAPEKEVPFDDEPAILQEAEDAGQVIVLEEAAQIPLADLQSKWMYCKKDAVFHPSVFIRPIMLERAQATVNLRFNGEVFATIQCVGYREDYFEVKVARAHLQKGFYKLEIEVVSPGIELAKLVMQ